MAHDFDPTTDSWRHDPYPSYARLREEHPVHYSERLQCWIVSRYADVVSVLRDPETFSSAKGVLQVRNAVIRRPTVLTRDPPDHTRLRALVSKAFTPRRVAELEPRIRQLVDEMLDRALACGTIDLVKELAQPLPSTIIADMLSVEPDRRADFQRWADDVFIDAAGIGPRPDRAKTAQSYAEYDAYFQEQIEARRRVRRDDLLSDLVAAHEDREALSTNEIISFCILLSIAGTETTTNLVSNAVYALLAHPREEAKLRARPELMPSAIEEVLRYDAPVPGLFRTTRRAVDLAGTTIPEDAKVFAVYASANRDRAQFPDPDRFDIERTPNAHLGLGHGLHYCLGAPLARLEGRIALSSFYSRTENLRLDPDNPPVRLDAPLARGFARLPLRFDAR